MPRIYPLYAVPIRNYIWRKFFQKVEETTGRPDVIHVHYPAMLMLGEILRGYHKKGTKIFITEHWSKVLTGSLDRIEKKQYKKYFEFADECICVGKSLMSSINEMVSNTKTHISVIPNIVDQYELPIQLKIIGDGKEYRTLKKLILNLEMQNQIILTGYLNKNQVLEQLANADCLICFSKYETFGVPIVEAWASGIPTITTTSAAVVADYFDERLGMEITPNNILGLREAMKYMYLHIYDYDSKFLIKFAKDHFSKNAVLQMLNTIYQSYE